MLKRLTKLLIFSLCISFYAQEPIRYTTKQGLPSNHIYDMQEDENGFMWFATNRGLVKYDGETFKTFTIKDGLPNNDTWLLETDYQKRLWYFSKSNYQGYIKDDSIYKFPTDDNKVISPRFIHKTKKRIWLNSSTGYQTLKNDTLKNTKDVGISLIWEEFDTKMNEIGKTYNFSYSNSRFFLNPENNKVIVFKENEILFFDENLKLIEKNKNLFLLNITNTKIDGLGLLYNQIFYFATDKGVLFVDFKNYKTKYFSFKKLVGVDFIKYFRCKGLQDEIQVSFPDHLLTFNYDMEFKESFTFPKELSRGSYKDTKGNIWLADFTNGISMLPNTQLKTSYLLQQKKVQKINKIDSVFYVGVNDDGFYRYNSLKKKYTQFLILKKANGEIYQIKKENPNSILFISSANSYIKKKTIKPLKINKGIKNFSDTSFKDKILYKNQNYFIVGSLITRTDNNYNFIDVFNPLCIMI